METITQDKIKVGDIYVTSWGYDQTNYDYIIVLSISPTGKTVKCQRTSFEHLGESAQSNIQEPINQPFGDVFQMKVKDCGWLVGSYPFCHDGKMDNKRLGRFYKHSKGHRYYETMPQFGH